jgi:ABC-type glycerol-3-phosphate transport system permease component
MVPFQVTMIPAFLIVKWLGLHVSPLIGIDSLGALIVPSLVQVFGIFMLRQFFRTLPIELEEAARIDGASRLGVLFKIILPLSLPALSTLAALMFLFSWNDFLWPLIVIQTQAHQTVQLGLTLLPRRARHAMDAPHGRERHELDPDAHRVLPGAAVLRPFRGHVGVEGVGRWRRSRSWT